MITISLSMPKSTLSARAPASDMDMRELRMSPFGTILIAAYFPVTECLAILTRPVACVQHKRCTQIAENVPELPLPIVRPILHWPIILASSLVAPEVEESRLDLSERCWCFELDGSGWAGRRPLEVACGCASMAGIYG